MRKRRFSHKKRPLFPNGYKKKKKEIMMNKALFSALAKISKFVSFRAKSIINKLKPRGKYTANQQELLNKLNSSIAALNYRMNKNKGVYKEEWAWSKKANQYVLIQQDLGKAYTRGWTKELELLQQAKKNLMTNRPDISDKQLAILTNLYSYKGKTSGYYTNITVSTKESRVNKLMMETLQRSGTDITNPLEIEMKLKGYTPEQIYEIWKEGDQKDTYYEIVSDVEKLDEFLANLDFNIDEINKKEEAQQELINIDTIEKNTHIYHG